MATLFFADLMAMRLYMFSQFTRNIFFNKQQARLDSDFYSFLSSITVFLLGIYIVYFILLAKKALDTIKHLNPSYRYAIGTTIFVMLLSAAILGNNGQASQRVDTLLFMSFYALVNFYIYLMVFLYLPASFDAAAATGHRVRPPKGAGGEHQELGALGGISEREKEHRDIMEEFYKDEVSDSDDEEKLMDGV